MTDFQADMGADHAALALRLVLSRYPSLNSRS